MTSQIDNAFADNFDSPSSHEDDVETTTDMESFPFGGFLIGIDSEDEEPAGPISAWQIKRNRFQAKAKHHTASKSNEEWLHTVHDNFDATRRKYKHPTLEG